jgi:hypothetical protein
LNDSSGAAAPALRASTTLVRMQEIGRHGYASTETILRLRGAFAAMSPFRLSALPWIATLVISALTTIPGPNSACPVESGPLAYPWEVGRRGSAADLQQKGAPGAAGGARSLRKRSSVRLFAARFLAAGVAIPDVGVLALSAPTAGPAAVGPPILRRIFSRAVSSACVNTEKSGGTRCGLIRSSSGPTACSLGRS